MMKQEYIIIHHTVTPQICAPDGINASHKERDFPISELGWYIGYHYLIGHDYVLQARKDTEYGSHAGADWNTRALGIAITGNYEEDHHLLAYQEVELSKLLYNLTQKYNIPNEKVILHRDTKATACPGRYIDQNYIHSLIRKPNMILQPNHLYQLVEGAGGFGVAIESETGMRLLVAANQDVVATFIMRNGGDIAGKTHTMTQHEWDSVKPHYAIDGVTQIDD